MLLLPSHRLRRRRFHNGRWSVFTYGWLRRHCDQTRPPPDRRAGADRRRRALGVPGGRAAGARRAVATVAQSVPDHRRHFRGRGGGGRAGRRSASLAARGRGTGAGVGELPLEPGLSRGRAAHDARRRPLGAGAGLRRAGAVAAQIDARQHAAARAAGRACGLQRHPPQHRARAPAGARAVLHQLRHRPLGRLLRRHRLHRRLGPCAARRLPHRDDGRSPDGERRHPAAVPAHQDR